MHLAQITVRLFRPASTNPKVFKSRCFLIDLFLRSETNGKSKTKKKEKKSIICPKKWFDERKYIHNISTVNDYVRIRKQQKIKVMSSFEWQFVLSLVLNGNFF